MMKKLIVCAAIASLTGSAWAANLDAGTKELRWNGMIDFDSAAGTRVDFGLGVGHFVMDYLEIGVEGAVSDDDIATTWSLGFFTQYSFDQGTQFVPYAGANVDIAGSDISVGTASSDGTGLQFGLSGGAMYFLTEDLAIDSLIQVRVATEDIYVADNDVENTDWRLLFGLRYFFDM